ncbi:MAG: cache domain-containing protein, partial [Bacteroidota bacterium]
MKGIKISIRRTSFFILMATATFTVLSITILWTFTEINKPKKIIADIKASYITDQRHMIKSEVLHVISMINFSRSIQEGATTRQLQNELLDYLSSIRLNYGGYIFINQYDGRALVFDGVKIIGDRNIKDLTDPDGLKIFDAELNAIRNPDGGFFTYKFKRLSTTKPVPKISFVHGYEDWKWIIGAGIYLDDLSLIIEQEKNHYQAILFKKVLYIIMVFAFLVIILWVIAMFISGFIRKEFDVFMSFFNDEPNTSSSIDDKKLRIVEFKQVARIANIALRNQRKIENLLILERDKARKYLDVADVIILAIDKVGNVTLINKKGWETLGYELEYILGKNWISYFVPLAQKQLLFDRFSFLMSDDKKVKFIDSESKIITKSGEEKIIKWHNTILYNDNGDRVGLLSSGKDITKRRKAERSFSESEEKYKLLFEMSSDPVLIIGPDNTFVDCNKAAIEILKFSSKRELIGLHPDKISPQKQPDGCLSIIKATEMIAKAKREGYNRFEWLHHNKNKELFYVDISLTVIPIDGVEYLYVVWRDVSERKKQDDELIVAKEKAEQGEDIKTSFLHNMQHEIRTPLNAIMGFSQLLKHGGLDVDETVSYYDDIINSGNQLNKIIDEIIDFSMLQAGFILITNKNVELNKLISEIFKEYFVNTQNKQIEFKINNLPSTQNRLVRADVNRLKQILGHLLDNAFKFTEEGSIEFGYGISDNEITFYVEDTGVGIEKKYLGSIFDKFNRITHKNPAKLYGGSGLGLSISKAVLTLLSGRIWVESEVNKGSRFTFAVPYRPINVEDKVQNAILNECNVTVVTNDEVKLKFISNLLRETEANIIHINTGIKAIEFCQNNFSTNLMIIDSDLHEMNSVVTTKAIKAFKKELPIVAFFANENEKPTKESLLIAGCDDYISMSQIENDIKLTLSVC